MNRLAASKLCKSSGEMAAFPLDGDDPLVLTSSPSPVRAAARPASPSTGRGAPAIAVWGDGSPTREFVYVEDAAEGIQLAAEQYDGEAPVNLGSGMEISIQELVKTICRLTGFHGDVTWDTSQPNGQPRRCLDTSRAEALFGFRARTPFEEGLRRTIAWYETTWQKARGREERQ